MTTTTIVVPTPKVALATMARDFAPAETCVGPNHLARSLALQALGRASLADLQQLPIKQLELANTIIMREWTRVKHAERPLVFSSDDNRRRYLGNLGRASRVFRELMPIVRGAAAPAETAPEPTEPDFEFEEPLGDDLPF